MAAGMSAEGSACAKLPPSVPRLRTCTSATTATVWESKGHFWRSSADCLISAYVVMAPMAIVPGLPPAPGSSRIVLSPPIRPRSTRKAGDASRSFRTGMRLWPPASSLASPGCDARKAAASAREAGARYSNLGGIMIMASSSDDLRFPNGPQDLFRGDGQRSHFHAERRQGVLHGVGDRGQRADGATFANRLCSEQRCRARRLHMRQFETRQAHG